MVLAQHDASALNSIQISLTGLDAKSRLLLPLHDLTLVIVWAFRGLYFTPETHLTGFSDFVQQLYRN